MEGSAPYIVMLLLTILNEGYYTARILRYFLEKLTVVSSNAHGIVIRRERIARVQAKLLQKKLYWKTVLIG